MGRFAPIAVRSLRAVRGLLVAGAALGVSLGCVDPHAEGASSGSVRPAALPEIALEDVRFPDEGLPDPCEILRAAGAGELLVRPLEPEPLRFEGLCLLQVDRGRRPEPQVSAALELATRERPQPATVEDYLVDYGEGLTMAGATPDDLEIIQGLGDFAVWFPHEDGSLTLSAFWDGRHFLSVEVHGVARQVAFDWSKALAAQVVQRL